jgi:hypothetical protein
MGKNDVEKSSSNAQVAVTPPLAPIATAGGTGSALFVINLYASIAPVRLDGNNIPGLENYRLYQVARNEDGRTRHRLRLGFFTSESHAESVLTVVRQQYPTAFTACLCEEDRRFARGYLPETAAAPRRPVAAVVAPTPAAQPKAAVVQQKPAAVPAKAATAPVAATKQAAPAKPTPAAAKTLAAAEPEVIELTWEPETPQAAPKAANGATATKPSAVASAEGLDEFTWEPPSLTPAADAAIAKTTAVSVAKPTVIADKAASDTARHPALKLAPKTAAKTPPAAAKPAAPVAAKAATPVARPAVPVAKPAAPLAKPAVPVARPATTPATSLAKPATPPAKFAAKPTVDTAASMRVRAPDFTISDPPAAPATAQRTASTEPFHVGKGVQFTDIDISLEAESAPRPAAPSQPSATHATKAGAPVKPKSDKAPLAAKPIATPAPKVPEKIAKPAHTPVAAKPTAPALPPIRITGASTAHPPELDSTQTIRALTSSEMDDAVQEKWFAVVLAVSEQPVNLDAMPRLDIFEAYRLYSVATAGSGKIVHSLRLGFFKEAVSAEAVSGYLKTFFGSPTIMRISVAEHARFKDPPSAKNPAAPAHEAKVVELNHARTARPVVPTVTMEVATGVDTAATGSFRPLDTGSFKIGATGTHKALATGTHKALNGAAKSAGPNVKRARAKTGNTGRHKALAPIEKRSLAEQLLDEAREVELTESGIRKLPKNDSLLSRMFGKLTK